MNTPLTWHGVMRRLTAMTVMELMLLLSGTVCHAIKWGCKISSQLSISLYHWVYFGLPWKSGYSLKKDRVISSNWDISAGLRISLSAIEYCYSGAMFLMEPEPHMLYWGTHLCPVSMEKSLGRKHFDIAGRGGRGSKTLQALLCQPATNIHPNCSAIVLN